MVEMDRRREGHVGVVICQQFWKAPLFLISKIFKQFLLRKDMETEIQICVENSWRIFSSQVLARWVTS
jgi:hypothetical protein